MVLDYYCEKLGIEFLTSLLLKEQMMFSGKKKTLCEAISSSKRDRKTSGAFEHKIAGFKKATFISSRCFCCCCLLLINPHPPPPPPAQKKKKKKKKLLNPLLACVVWGIRNCESSPLFLGIRNSESIRVLFGRSAILDVLLCFCKGWHLLMNCRLCSLRIKKLESLPVFYGEPTVALGTRNTDNPLVA